MHPFFVLVHFCARFCPNRGAVYSIISRGHPRTFPHVETSLSPILSKKHPGMRDFVDCPFICFYFLRTSSVEGCVCSTLLCTTKCSLYQQSFFSSRAPTLFPPYHYMYCRCTTVCIAPHTLYSYKLVILLLLESARHHCAFRYFYVQVRTARCC